MSNGIVDLHVHSTKSDGSMTPAQLVDYACKKGLSAFALTDHDTVAGIDEAVSAAKGKPITVIPGIELSTEYLGKDVHIVGLMIDYKCEEFQKKIHEFVDSRELRNEKMCRLLQEGGIPVEYEVLKKHYQDSVITRAHFARYMLETGYIKSLKEAFERYIGDHSPYYVPRQKVTPQDGIALIRAAKGIPVLAHPLLYHLSDQNLLTLVKQLEQDGLEAIEAIYSTYTPSEERKMKAFAKENNLLISGGSDFHGATKPSLELATGYGSLRIPEEIYQTLLQRRKELYHE